MGYNDEGYTDYEETLNWDTVGSVVAVGDYDAEIIKVEYAQTKANKHMLKVQLRIESAYDEENEKSVGRTVFDNWTFSQEGGFRPKAFSVATGTTLPKVVNKPLLEEFADSITGSKVGLSITHREYNGQTQPSISKFFPYQNAETVESDSKQERSEPARAAAPQAASQSVRQAVAAPKSNGANGAAKEAGKAAVKAPAMVRR